MCQFNGVTLERRFPMMVEQGAFDKLKEQLIFMDDMESCENDIYGLKIWVDGLAERQIVKQEQRQNSGERIIQVVKEKVNDRRK